MSDGPNLYAYCHNDPINAVDLWGRDTYYGNKEFFRAEPTNNPFSHSFAFSTDFDPVTGREIVTDTYSWTDERDGSWHRNAPQDIESAQKAIDRKVGYDWYGDESLDQYVEQQYNSRSFEEGTYDLFLNNCKEQTWLLLDDALKQRSINENNKDKK